MSNQITQFGGLVVEMDLCHCHGMVQARRAGPDHTFADDDYLQVQALEQEGKAVAAFPYLEAGNWFCRPPWLAPNKWYLITVFPGAVARLVV
jgi:hypothetical protein